MSITVRLRDLDENGRFVVPDGVELVTFTSFPKLESLDGITLPRSVKKLAINFCPNTTSLPPLPDGIEEITLLGLPDLESLADPPLPRSLKTLSINSCPKVASLSRLTKSVEKLELYDLPNLESLEGLNLQNSLKTLKVASCPRATSLPSLVEGIEDIHLSNLPELDPTWSALPRSLKNLTLFSCPKLTSLPPLVEGIEEITLDNLPELASLGDTPLPRSLKILNIYSCPKVTSLPPLCEGIRELRIDNFPELTGLGDDALPASLKRLSIYNCPKLTSLPPLAQGIEEIYLCTLADLTRLENDALPASLKKLTIIDCPQLTSLPRLPERLRFLDISRASALRFTPELVEQLQALEARGCDIRYPRGYVERDTASGRLQGRVEAAAEAYRSAHPEYTGTKLMTLIRRYLSESVWQRDAVPDLIRALEPVVAFAEQHPEHLGWMEEVASAYLDGCVNQPVAGHGELCAWIAVASETTMTGKVEAAKRLLALEEIKQYVVDNFTSRGVEVEAGNALLREVHARLLQEKIITKPWTGVPKGIAYEGSVRSFITDERVQEAVAKVKAVLDQPVDKVVSFLCTTHAQSYWSAIALDSDALHAKRKEVDGKFAKQEEACEILANPYLASDKDKMREAEDRRCGREFRELLEERPSEASLDEFATTATQLFMQRKAAEHGQARIDMTQELLARECQPGNVLGGCGAEKGIGATKVTSISG